MCGTPDQSIPTPSSRFAPLTGPLKLVPPPHVCRRPSSGRLPEHERWRCVDRWCIQSWFGIPRHDRSLISSRSSDKESWSASEGGNVKLRKSQNLKGFGTHSKELLKATFFRVQTRFPPRSSSPCLQPALKAAPFFLRTPLDIFLPEP